MFMFLTKLKSRALTCLLAACVAGQGAVLQAEPFKVVIDAGHGGHDIGAPGKKTNEKSINLGVAKALAEELRAMDDFEVIMTRDKDNFVTLIGRANIANKASGDLFVSVHTNSLDKKNPKAKTISGTSVYTLGLSRSDDNLAVAMRENSVMTLEPDYTTTYQGFDPNSAESYIIFEMDQNLHLDQSISAARYIQEELVRNASRRDRGVRQGPFSVLRNTSMPAVLIELDFICNPSQEQYMASKEGMRELAVAIADGIAAYKEEVDRARAKIDGSEPPKSTGKKKTSTRIKKERPVADSNDDKTAVEDTEVYKIQFLTAPRKLRDRDFKGLDDVSHYRQGNTYKYTTGSFATRSEAESRLPKVRKKFKDAFIILMRGNQRLE